MSAEVNVKRYDRQLRLWGDHGQLSLERGRVCLIGATTVGTEALKNILLPGIGQVTLIDNAILRSSDLGCNFFATKDQLGEKRADACAKNLQSLNPDVKVCSDTRSLQELTESLSDLDDYSAVIMSSCSEPVETQISQYLYERHIPVIICHSVGMIGYVRLVCQEHVVFESHPDFVLDDLRLHQPIPEFVEFSRSFPADLTAMDSQKFSHVPWLVLLYRAVERWRQDHALVANSFPRTSKEKDQVCTIMRACQPPPPEIETEENERLNMSEGLEAVNKALTTSSSQPNSELSQLLTDTKSVRPAVELVADLVNATNSMQRRSAEFWLLIKALSVFVDSHGFLPIRGVVPDMHSDSESFLRLRTIYRQAALNHAKEVHQTVEGYFREYVAAHSSTADDGLLAERLSMPFEQVASFCKNAAFVRCIRPGRQDGNAVQREHGRIVEKLRSPSEWDPVVDGEYWLPVWHGMLRFHSIHHRYPGESLVDYIQDLDALRSIMEKEFSVSRSLLYGDDSPFESRLIEACRWSGRELHSISAYLGAIIGHELIKLLTGQFMPLQNTFVYSATAGQHGVVLNIS